MTGVPLTISEWLPAPIRLPNSRHEFAIGDVHGMTPAFVTLLAAMGRASAGRGWLTLLGDLCDRGPDTLGAYRAAFGLAPGAMGFRGRTGLLGNHEGMMLGGLEPDPRAGGALSLWLPNGGRTVLGELGLEAAEVLARPVLLRRALEAALGTAVMKQLSCLKSHRKAGNLLFVHAGVLPGVPLRVWFQAPPFFPRGEDHWSWIRYPFLQHEEAFEGSRLVVHGHTPEGAVQRWKDRTDAPEELHRLDGWRLGLDGGSYATGRVAGAEFRPGAYRVYVAGEAAS